MSLMGHSRRLNDLGMSPHPDFGRIAARQRTHALGPVPDVQSPTAERDNAVTANHSLPIRMLERPARGTISRRAALEIHCTKTSMVARRG
jgi:hypothetical protein